MSGPSTDDPAARPQGRVSTARIDRILSNLGYATRREAAALVAAGRVRVGDSRATSASAHADPHDVRVDDELLDHPDGILVVVHKPVGYVCSHDEREGKRVYDLLPPRWMARNPVPATVGRLDKDSSGLVLVTSDMPLIHALTSPKRHVTKRYDVVLDAEPDVAVVERFSSGELLLEGDEKPCLPARVVLGGGCRATVELTEGRNRQLRRMFQAVGLEVIELHRTAFGHWELGDLAAGSWREA